MVSHPQSRLRGILFAMAAAIAWSSGGVAIKLLPLPASSISGFRALFALPVLIAVLLLRTEAARDAAFYRFALREPTVYVGALAYALCVTLFVQATKLTTAANAILFQYSAPIYTALLSWPLLGERVRGADWLAVLGCSCGMALCFAEKLSAGGTTGNLLAMLSGLGFALLPLMWRKQLTTAVQDSAQPKAGAIPPNYRLHLPEVTLILGNVITMLVALPALLRDPPHGAISWLGVALLGTVQIGFAYLLYGEAVRRLRAIECLLAATLEPILNPLWVALWAHETPGRSTILGGSVILLTVLLHGIYNSRRSAVTT